MDSSNGGSKAKQVKKGIKVNKGMEKRMRVQCYNISMYFGLLGLDTKKSWYA